MTSQYHLFLLKQPARGMPDRERPVFDRRGFSFTVQLYVAAVSAARVHQADWPKCRPTETIPRLQLAFWNFHPVDQAPEIRAPLSRSRATSSPNPSSARKPTTKPACHVSTKARTIDGAVGTEFTRPE